MSDKKPAPVFAPEVARLLGEIATLGELNGENPYRSRAFASAARALEGTTADLATLADAGELTSLKGVGPAIAEVIDELVRTGRSTIYEELRAATPIGLYDLLRIPGLGTSRIHTIHQKLGVESLDDLEEAARAGRVAALPKFGKKTEDKILKGVDFARAAMGRRRYPEAREVADRLLDWLRSEKAVSAADIAGSVRRRLEIIDRVELVAASDKPAKVLDAFAALNGVAEVGERGDDRVVARLNDGLTASLKVVSPDAFVACLVRETGAREHIAELEEAAADRKLAFDEAGLSNDGKPLKLADEQKFYAKLGLQFIPPEMREGLGEISLAREKAIPQLIELDDLTGTFHCHTTYSDGRASVAEMGEAARSRGWSYLGLADHSRAAAYAGGLSVERVYEQQAAVDEWNGLPENASPKRFRLFKGIESDILANGDLDYDDEVLASFDYVVGSVHSGFSMSEAEMTKRVLSAVQNPHLTILGHPTGRLLLRRDGYPIDVRAVIEAAAANKVIIEINSNPNRLDLDWRDIRYAVELGVLIAINPDAHSVGTLDNVQYGINMARKAGLEARGVINTWTLKEVESYFAERKQKR